MADVIKYSTSAQTLALKDGNFWIGVGDVPKGTTVNTDYYNGITPPTGGYTIYLNKATGGPSIYVASSDAELISLTNKIVGSSYTTVYDCLYYFSTQSDKMVMNIDYPAIPTNGITFISDIGSTISYPLGGYTSSSMDPTTNGGYVAYQNGARPFSDAYGLGMQFDGIDDVAYTSVTSGGFGTYNTAAFTFVMICRSNNSTANQWSANGGIGSNRYADGTGWLMYNSTGNNKVAFYMGDTSSPYSVTIATSVTIPNIDVPHMYVISSNGTNLHKGYVDNGSAYTSTTSITRAAAQHEIIFGRDGYISGTNLKVITYVQIMYDRQLSDAEVLQLYSAYQGRFGF
jgi:hypothetical protein